MFLTSTGSYHVTLTTMGKVCKFPFKYEGKDQWTCVPKNGLKESWCATKVDENRIVLETDTCPDYHSKY